MARRNPPQITYALIGLGVVALVLILRKKSAAMSEAEAKSSWTPPQPGSASPVPGVPTGQLAPVDLGNGRVLDPRGIPIGSKLADGRTWTGVSVLDTAAYARAHPGPVTID